MPAFCKTCCADVFAANGRIDAAQAELEQAVRELLRQASGPGASHPRHDSRKTRVLQGRLDEAEQLLAGVEAEPEAMQARVAVRIARGETEAASASSFDGRTSSDGRELPAWRLLLAQLVETRIAEGLGRPTRKRRPPRSTSSPWDGLLGIASTTRSAVAAHGRFALSEGRDDAPLLLQQAVNRFAALGLRLDAARARLEFARSLAPTSREVAIDTARRC